MFYVNGGMSRGVEQRGTLHKFECQLFPASAYSGQGPADGRITHRPIASKGEGASNFVVESAKIQLKSPAGVGGRRAPRIGAAHTIDERIARYICFTGLHWIQISR